MLRAALRPRRWRTLAGVLAALLAAPAVAVGTASVAQADAVRQQELWVLNAIGVAGAWQHTHGSGVTVALIDSGVNGQVSDLSGSVTTGRDFSGVNTPPTNPNWGVHGTWMASLIAGHGHAGGSAGIMGVAPAAKILSIRAVTDQGDPGYHHYQHESESRVQGHLAAAINYAASSRVSVISMSLGYQGASLPVRVAISKALAKGIVVVASSGNSGGASSGSHGNAPYSFPADYPGVLGVGAVAQDGQPAGFSSDNLSVQVAAPGVRVPAQGRDGQYWLVSGTSPACALTAGVAALIKSVYPRLAPALVVQAITASASHRPQGGYDEEVGFGTVDAAAALRTAGRLARDQGIGRGEVATTQFGGGTGAIPPVPVAARNRRQFVVDSLIALACLAVVLILAFRLIAARRPAGAAAGVPQGWAGPGPPGGWTGAAPPGPRTPSGWPGGGAPASAAPSGWAGSGAAPSGWAGSGATPTEWAGSGATPTGWAGSGVPAAGTPNGWAGGGQPDHRASGRPAGGPPAPGAPDGWAGAGPPNPGPGSAGGGPAGAAAAGSAGTWPDGNGAADERSARYWAGGGYKPSSEYPPPPGDGSSDVFQPPASAGAPPLGGNGQAVGYGMPREQGPSPSGEPATGSAPQPAIARPPTSAPPPVAPRPAPGNGQAAGDPRPSHPAIPGVPGAPERVAANSAGAKTGPVAGLGEPAEPQDLPESQAAAPPAADDDTLPSPGQW